MSARTEKKWKSISSRMRCPPAASLAALCRCRHRHRMNPPAPSGRNSAKPGTVEPIGALQVPSAIHRLAPATFRAHIRAESAGSQADRAREKRDRVPEMSWKLERARRFERPTPTLARLCSTPELRPLTGATETAWSRWGGGQLAAALESRKSKNADFSIPLQRRLPSFTFARQCPHDAGTIFRTKGGFTWRAWA